MTHTVDIDVLYTTLQDQLGSPSSMTNLGSGNRVAIGKKDVADHRDSETRGLWPLSY